MKQTPLPAVEPLATTMSRPPPAVSRSPHLRCSPSLLLPLLTALALLLSPAARAMSVVAPTFTELVTQAETVLRGTVTAIRAEEFDSPQGRGIRTLVTLNVERTLKGPPAPADTVTLVFLGGTVGSRTLRVVGMPRFEIGRRQIVFFAHNGTALCPLVSAGHGRYHVVTDSATQRDYVARDNDVPLSSTDEIPLPLASTAVASVAARLKSPAAALSLAAFEAQIAATLNPGASTVQP